MEIEIFIPDIVYSIFSFLLPFGEGRGVPGSLRKLKVGFRPKLTFAYERGQGVKN